LSYYTYSPPALPTIYTLSLHDALPIYCQIGPVLAESRANWKCSGRLFLLRQLMRANFQPVPNERRHCLIIGISKRCRSPGAALRSEEHTSELQSRFDLVCRLLLVKKKK